MKYYFNPKMQKKFREKMNGWEINDRFIPFEEDPVIVTCHEVYAEAPISYGYRYPEQSIPFIRLPLPIDPVNPERGLWGMIDWSKSFHSIGPFAYDTRNEPVLALLYILAYQWNIKIEKDDKKC